jgi:hypothetical protein
MFNLGDAMYKQERYDAVRCRGMSWRPKHSLILS